MEGGGAGGGRETKGTCLCVHPWGEIWLRDYPLPRARVSLLHLQTAKNDVTCTPSKTIASIAWPLWLQSSCQATSCVTLRCIPPAPLPRYYRCVCAVETRFPISKEKGAANVSFAWFDAFRPSRRTAQHNIHFEKSAVLFNMASLASQQGLQSDRTSAEGLTQACKLFQVEKGEGVGRRGGARGYVASGSAVGGRVGGAEQAILSAFHVSRRGQRLFCRHQARM